MSGRNRRSGVVAALALGAGMVAASPPAAASSVMATIGPIISTNSGDALGTFTFVIPSGETVVSAEVALPSFSFPLTGGIAAFDLDGARLGTASFGFDQSATYALVDLSVLDDGLATLVWASVAGGVGCACVILETPAVLTITTAESVGVAEPAGMALLGMSLAGLAAVRRRR